MTKLVELEQRLGLMRRETADFALERDYDGAKLLKMRHDCAALWGAIESFKKGQTPVLESSAKYLR